MRPGNHPTTRARAERQRCLSFLREGRQLIPETWVTQSGLLRESKSALGLPESNLFFWTPGAMNGSTKVQSSQANRWLYAVRS